MDVMNDSLVVYMSRDNSATKNFVLWRLVSEVLVQDGQVTWEIVPVDVKVDRNKGMTLFLSLFGLEIFRNKSELEKPIKIAFPEDCKISLKSSGVPVFWILPNEFSGFPEEVKQSIVGNTFNKFYDYRRSLKTAESVMNEQSASEFEFAKAQNSSSGARDEMMAGIIEQQRKPFKEEVPEPRRKPQEGINQYP